MKELFKKRLFNHLTMMTKYLKYVFNDFFVIALIFLVGGLGLEYSNILKHLYPNIWWTNIIILLVLLISIQFGKLATFIKKPDYIFLAPKDKDFSFYFKRTYIYSLTNSFVIQIVIWFIFLPFIKVSTKYNWLELISYLILLLLLKNNWMKNDMNKIRYVHNSMLTSSLFNKFILPFILLLIAVWINIYISVILSLIWLIYQIYQSKISKINPINWNYVINIEKNRMHNIYRIFNLFVDIPNINSTIKRRSYLNPLLNRIKWNYNNSYLYLYLHGILRNKELSGLYIRLTFIGFLLLLIINNITFIILFSILFIYLISFQIIPFYNHFIDNVFTHIYPLNNKYNNFKYLIICLLFIVDILFVVSSFISIHSFSVSLLLIILLIIETYLLTYAYLPYRINKMINNK